MKTFLKVLLIAALLVLAIKLSPVLFFLAIAGLAAAGLLGVMGVSLAAALLAVLTALVFVLAPIWIPVLIVVGLVHLIRRDRNVPPVMV
jgi:hypothetical protein